MTFLRPILAVAIVSFSRFGALALLLACPRAEAGEAAAPGTNPAIEDPTRVLAVTSRASAIDAAAVTTAWGGFESAAGTPVASVGAEVRVFGRLSLLAGVAYGASAAADRGFRPQVGARVQILHQAASGVDAGASFLFRQDRFTSEDGLLQGCLAFGRSFGATSAVLNLVYGQDGEGDDRLGEVRMAALGRVRGGLHLGAEARYMHSIASTDPKRAALGTPSMELMAGPVASYTAGPWAFVIEAGVASRRTSGLQTGAVGLAGIGTAF